jgi:hypothetical protein
LAQTGAPYARVPGIRVYGMLCLKSTTKKRRAKMLAGFGLTAANPEEEEEEEAFNEIEEGALTLPSFPTEWETFADSLSDFVS